MTFFQLNPQLCLTIADDMEFRHPSMVPLSSETHSGEDVAVFALGPWQHLYTGIYEQNVIPQIMVYASCIEKGFSACENNQNWPHFI